jgi:hypothetical protein
MDSLPYTRLGDLPSAEVEAGRAIDPTPLLGTWVNTKDDTTGIYRFVLARTGDRVTIHAFGHEAPFDWGEAEVTLFAPNVDSSTAVAFNAQYDFGFMKSYLGCNSNEGLTIIASYNQFTDGSGRSNYICREFYYREQ